MMKEDEPDRVARAQSDPLRDRTVLFLGFCELLFRAEGFVGLDSLIRDLVSQIWRDEDGRKGLSTFVHG